MAFPWTTLLPGKSSAKGIDEARDLITEPRHSAPSKQLLDEIDETRLHYSDRNETTFTNKFFGVFQSKCRQVKLQAQGDSAQPDNDEEIDDQADSNQGDFHVPAGWAARDWADDGLDENDNRVFQAGSVPRIGSANENHKAILNDLPRISNPQPDIIHGEFCLVKSVNWINAHGLSRDFDQKALH